jgi:hypothetical protein
MKPDRSKIVRLPTRAEQKGRVFCPPLNLRASTSMGELSKPAHRARIRPNGACRFLAAKRWGRVEVSKLVLAEAPLPTR